MLYLFKTKESNIFFFLIRRSFCNYYYKLFSTKVFALFIIKPFAIETMLPKTNEPRHQKKKKKNSPVISKNNERKYRIGFIVFNFGLLLILC